MFVISLIGNGKLKKTAIKSNANDAVDLAQFWYKENKDEHADDGYIAIERQVKGEEENVLFAEIRFDQSDEEAKLFIALSDEGKNKPVFSSKFALLTKHFLIHFFEYSLVKLTEYIMNKNKNGRGGL
jgi:hypothetical protein